MTQPTLPAPAPEAVALTRRRLARLLALGAVRAATRRPQPEPLVETEEARDALAG
jgi:hypothetical protein